MAEVEKGSSKYSNLENSIKLKESTALKPNEIFMMNTNTNHHYNYFHNSKSGKVSARESTNGISGNFTNNDSSNIDISFKAINPISGISGLMKDHKPKTKQSRKSSRSSKKIEDPAIPFPQSQKHHSSKLGSNDTDRSNGR